MGPKRPNKSMRTIKMYKGGSVIARIKPIQMMRLAREIHPRRGVSLTGSSFLLFLPLRTGARFIGVLQLANNSAKIENTGGRRLTIVPAAFPSRFGGHAIHDWRFAPHVYITDTSRFLLRFFSPV